MAKERMFDFCTSCRKETSYKMCKKALQKVIKEKTNKEVECYLYSILDSKFRKVDEM